MMEVGKQKYRNWLLELTNPTRLFIHTSFTTHRKNFNPVLWRKVFDFCCSAWWRRRTEDGSQVLGVAGKKEKGKKKVAMLPHLLIFTLATRATATQLAHACDPPAGLPQRAVSGVCRALLMGPESRMRGLKEGSLTAASRERVVERETRWHSARQTIHRVETRDASSCLLKQAEYTVFVALFVRPPSLLRLDHVLLFSSTLHPFAASKRLWGQWWIFICSAFIQKKKKNIDDGSCNETSSPVGAL